MDVPRKSARKQRIIKRIVMGVVGLVAVGGLSVVIARLKPAAPSVEFSTLWPGTVRRGPMVRDVRGLGTLVPEETLLIPAMTDGRVARIYIRPGVPVRANDIIMKLENPDLQTDLLDKEFAVKAAEATYTDLRVTLEKAVLDLQSTAAQVSADYHTARLKAERDSALAKEGLVADVDAQISVVTAKELATRDDIEKKRLTINVESVEAQLAKAKVTVEQARGAYQLKKQQVEALNVRSGVDGTLQALPTPVEEGQKVVAGTPLGKISQPSKLKAVLKITETQVKDVAIGQSAMVDLRNGIVSGHVSRIDPSVINGTVDVDVKIDTVLPSFARPDLSVDGTIQLEKLDDVVFVDRPVFGQADSTVTLFKMEPDGKYANRVQVKFGKSAVNTIEVREGLRVGDRVILSDMSAMDGYDRIRLN